MKFSEMEYKRPDLAVVQKEFKDLILKFEAAGTVAEQNQILSNIYELRNGSDVRLFLC